MEFKQLQSFVAVVDYGSFTKASEKLFISQPTISTHIRMLEETDFRFCLKGHHAPQTKEELLAELKAELEKLK